jgi:hypothetical protein
MLQVTRMTRTMSMSTTPMTRRVTRWMMSLALVATAGCQGSVAALDPCVRDASGTAICDLQNPEDMAVLPGRSWIVVSEMASGDPNSDADSEQDEPFFEAGRLTALRFGGLERRTLFPVAAAAAGAGTPAGWGDPGCPGPPDPAVFQPHGIDVGVSSGGRPALLVVNHGGREAVEFFEIMMGRDPAIEWRGCVPMLEGRMANDVAFVPGGGFVVTNMLPRMDGPTLVLVWNLMKMSVGGRTGSVLSWQPGDGLKEIENSEGSAPNGIVASPDGTELFVAEWSGHHVYRLRLEGQGAPTRDEIVVDHRPDNLTWTRDGRLLVTGQYGGLGDALRCGEIRDAGCDMAYSVYLVEPIGLEAEKIIEGRGAASVALEVAEEIYVGAYVGDQIERRSPLPSRSIERGESEANPTSAR